MAILHVQSEEWATLCLHPSLSSGVLPVAFIGQVPVKVRGPVNSGDYILPSGLNDGIGIAINPKTITFGQYREAIGIAWESSKEKIAKVNVAVGIK